MSHEIELSISCNACVRRGTSDCGDCLVTHVLGEDPDTLEMSEREATITQLFVDEGLVPRLRYEAIASHPSSVQLRRR